jgi:hypothetical protein
MCRVARRALFCCVHCWHGDVIVSLGNIHRFPLEKIYTQIQSKYYKDLFGQLENCDITLREDQNLDIPQVSLEENDILVSPFSESEVREAVF